MKLKQILYQISLLIISLYIPFFFSAYSSVWYDLNYKLQNTNEIIGQKTLENSTNNLILFFIHKENLDDSWSNKEKLHFKDVRKIYDSLFLLFIISVIIIFINFKKINFKKISRNNIIFLLVVSFLIFPFFSYFWDSIFHIILFNNDLWIMNENDLSYYIFPLNFFINSALLTLLTSLIINSIIFFRNKKSIDFTN